MDAHQYLPYDEITKNKDWFELIEDTGRYRCRLCAKYKPITPLRRGWYSELANVEGVMKNKLSLNRKMIRGHR